MVFESVVADVLNRFLGDYVENLNRNQLKIGIWGGDVVLENLALKQNALDELDLPVKTIFGHLGKLVLKIPWKNLYGASVEASIERLFLLVAPNKEVKYDSQKEEKLALESKQSELSRIEEAKKREREKDQPKVDDSFVEKLVTQIIKNVQLNIKDIHIRYEDKVTNPGHPFSLGISLYNLSVNTTDEKWIPCVLEQAVTKIYKVLDLEALAFYWNPGSDLYSCLDREQILQKFMKDIATKSEKPTTYKYILGPINASAKLKLNPKPEQDKEKFSIPKCVLTLDMEQLAIGITKAQYLDIMKLADSMERMSKGQSYRKYRPFLQTYRGHYKEWWRFAYTCILEEEVRRRRKNWDWNNILQHRNTCRQYAQAYQTKLQTIKNKIPNDLECLLSDCEKTLDLFNLVVIRQRIEMEVARLGKAKEEANKSRGWFSSWWGGATDKDDELAETTDIMKKFEKAMTPEEKSKLFKAIDYQENSAPTHLPIEFIATQCYFTLGCLLLNVDDDRQDVLTAKLCNVQASLEQRPSANALKVMVRMQEFTVSGIEQNGATPKIVTSEQITPGISLMDVMFETNPLDDLCDKRLKISARPLQIIYDAQTIIKIVSVFKPPSESSALAQLQAAANNKLLNLKEKSALGLQHAVNQHDIMDIDIDFCSSYLIMPCKGIYTGNEPCVVINFGATSVKAAPRVRDSLDVNKMFREGADNDKIFLETMKHAYDKFLVQLTDIQVVIADKGEDWKSIIANSTVTPSHLLKPTTLKIELDKCLITDDPRLPKLRIYGHLPHIGINALEDRLMLLLEILISIPFPEGEPTPSFKLSDSVASIIKYIDPTEAKKRQAERKEKTALTAEECLQLTEVEAEFIMGELVLCILKSKKKSANDSVDFMSDRLLTFELCGLQMNAAQRTLTLEASVKLGGVEMVLHRPHSQDLNLVKTLRGEDDFRQYLFTINYTNVNKICPDFHNRYGSVEQLFELDFTILQVVLHQEGIQELMKVAGQYQTKFNAIQGNKDRVASAGTPLSTIPEDQEVASVKQSKIASGVSKMRKSGQVETIGLKVQIAIEQVGVEIATEERSLGLMAVTGLKAGLILKNSYTQVDASLQDITIMDNNPETIHKKIVTIVGGDALKMQVVIFNLDHYANLNSNDMTLDVQISCIRIVFLNWFVSSMLKFLDNFQTATQAIKDASAMAAESAKANVQNAYEKAYKIGMNIGFKAPIVIVPENSKSPYAIMVDLGYITMTNNFDDIDVKERHRVTIESLTLSLQNFKMSRVKLSVEDVIEVTNEKNLLRPTSFNLTVNRNLSSSWYNKIPGIDMSGRLKAIAVKLANDDFKMVMKILSENLTEGSSKAPVPAATDRPPLKSSVSVESSRTAQLKRSETAMYAAKVKEASSSSGVWTTMKFTFTMDSLTIEMTNLKPNSNNKLMSPMDSAEETGLARFSLLLLSIKGKMLSDDSMYTSLLLVDCILDDIRPNRESKITCLMQRKDDVGRELKENADAQHEKLRSMIDVTFSQKQADMFADVRIFSFNLILSVDFMMKLSDYVTGALLPPSKEELELVESTESQLVKSGASTTSKKTPQSKKEVVRHAPEHSKQTGMMTIRLKVEKPDIILVETMEGNTDCQAIVLNNEISFNMRMTEDRKVMDGIIEQLQLFTCRFGKHGVKPKGRYSVLEPCDLSLQASAGSDGVWKIAIDVTDIKLHVSPATIELLNRVLVTMTKSEDDVGNKVDQIQLYKDLWEVKKFQQHTYWFLKTELAEDAMDLENILSQPQSPELSGELCIVSAPVIVLSVEAGIGNDTMPMLIMQAALQAQVKDWSSQLNMESTMQIVMSYYNESQALWEPFIEPVEISKDHNSQHVPWELKMQVQMNKDTSPARSSSISGLTSPGAEDTSVDLVDGGEVVLPQPAIVVQISSSDMLELTVTSTALQVLTKLGASFSSAVHGTYKDKIHCYSSPYLVKNDTGLSVVLDLEKDVFQLHTGLCDESLMELTNPPAGDLITLLHGESVGLEHRSGVPTSTKLNEKLPNWMLHIMIPELDAKVSLPVVKTDKRYFPLRGTLNESQVEKTGLQSLDGVGFISQVSVIDGTIHVSLRSIMQVVNNLSVPVEVHFMTNSENYVESLGFVEPKGVMNLPLKAVHTRTTEVFFSIDGYNVCAKPFVWKNLRMTIKEAKLLSCTAKTKEKDKFFLKAYGEMEQIFLADTNRRTMTSTCFNITLCPAVVLQNTLPVEISVSAVGVENPEEKIVAPGATLHLPHIDPGNTQVVILLPSYLEKCWSCTREIQESAPEFDVWTFESHDSTLSMTLDLGMHCSEVNGSQHFSLYCPFWMLNKTGLTLAYRSSEELSNTLYHPPEYKEPILFSFRAKNFFGKKKASIRIENGDWSEKFSLDIPGSSGVVLCKWGEMIYQIGVANHLTYNSLTKQVTFTPYFILINNAPFAMECQELDRPGDPFKMVEANSSIPLWPRSQKEDKLLRIKAVDDPALSAPFIYTDQHTSLLKLNNDYGGVNVETLVTEGGVYVTLDQYRPGFAPALIINHTQFDVKLWEKESINIKVLHGMHSILYTWENPAGPRVIVFEGFKKKEVENDLRKDGLGEFMVGNETRMFWVSFLDGMQRVLLFTSELLIAHSAHTAGETAGINMEVTISMHGLGLSLVNNAVRQEIMYMSIASSGIIWEQCKMGSKRYKPINMQETAMLEAAYQRHLIALEVGKSKQPSRVQVDNNVEVDFAVMEMLKPKTRKLRRIMQPGVWVQYGFGTHRSQLHARLHRLQIDQQLPSPTFPVILAPVPPPKSVASSQAMKPFVELCIVQRLMEHTNIKQYKYFKILVQEFQVKIDLGLVNALLELFPQEEITETIALEKFAEDLKYAGRPLESVVAEYTATDQKNFFDLVHLSPLKAHVSFSMGGAQQLPSFLGTVLQGIGVTLTDMNDVIFKLAYYERNYEFLSQKELMATATSHYTGQALKQLYVLVLGLDVIGNPYGLVIGLTKGVEDLFYEPFQGAIQGPGEFAEGLYLGVRSLFGHAVGGAAGAFSRITGAMGHGLAALSLDEEYQRKRRDNITKRPANLQQGIARSGKGLLMGVVDGVTGVVTKPISGAKEEGALGFFKGLGKGAVGLVARPTAGIVDFASGSFDAVKRAAEVSHDVSRIRNPRWLESDGLVRPYSKHSAEGYKLLRDLDKGKYTTTDLYVSHVWVVIAKEVVLCTDKRIAYLERNTVFGGWQIVWSYTWTEIPTPPAMKDNGVFIPIPDDGKKKGLFGKATAGKVILIHDSRIRAQLIETCLNLIKDAH